MDEAAIEKTFAAAERALQSPVKVDLAAIGFWKAVGAVKRRPDLVERYAERIARIDRAAFERQVPLRFPTALGVVVDLTGTAVGIALIALVMDPVAVIAIFPPPQVPFWQNSPWRELVFLAGMGALIGTTHTLAHWVVGRLAGIRFTHFFTKPPLRPQPGFKIDYASYLRSPARLRAWMHASGAIVTKLVPFVMYPFALTAGLAPWATWVILAIAVIQLITDALFSVRASDWKKFRREMRAARV